MKRKGVKKTPYTLSLPVPPLTSAGFQTTVKEARRYIATSIHPTNVMQGQVPLYQSRGVATSKFSAILFTWRTLSGETKYKYTWVFSVMLRPSCPQRFRYFVDTVRTRWRRSEWKSNHGRSTSSIVTTLTVLTGVFVFVHKKKPVKYKYLTISTQERKLCTKSSYVQVKRTYIVQLSGSHGTVYIHYCVLGSCAV
jgi:hypothetical protein